MKNTKKGMSKGGMVAVGAGLAAAGAGAYYLLGPNKKAHQKKAKALLEKMKKEVNAKAKSAKIMAKPMYDKAVDSMAATYSKQYKMHEGEIKALAKKLKGEWQAKATKVVKKTIKKAKAKVGKKK